MRAIRESPYSVRSILSSSDQMYASRCESLKALVGGLGYLHNGCKPPIVQRDVNAANILINEKIQAKIADFGLSRSVALDGTNQDTTAVAGTIGYLDPE
ncbi:unnamed protein product [Eruca vesicaria subsp. sativa]|uniref:Protein kinase domain-containing protein n=1 Tax=Eruca vesicaria subsp. sativa TaxID=29727 RepID=A0ABC8M8Q1_ERUVS|nr:unnamed protein product [Eruca vesicaria subsp. sativa]